MSLISFFIVTVIITIVYYKSILGHILINSIIIRKLNKFYYMLFLTRKHIHPYIRTTVRLYGYF